MRGQAIGVPRGGLRLVQIGGEFGGGQLRLQFQRQLPQHTPRGI